MVRTFAWRLAAFIHEGFGAFVASVLLLALSAILFHEAFARSVAQGEEAKKVLVAEQEPYRGEKYPTVASILIQDANGLDCTKTPDWSHQKQIVLLEQLKRAYVTSPQGEDCAPVRCLDPACNNGELPAGWMDCIPDSDDPKTRCPQTANGGSASAGSGSAGSGSAGSGSASTPSERRNSDFRMPTGDIGAVTNDCNDSARLDAAVETTHALRTFPSVYRISAQGSIRIAPRGRLVGVGSHHFWGSASYFQELIEDQSPCVHPDGEKIVITRPYLDLVGLGAVQTACILVTDRDLKRSTKPNADGIICVDFQIETKPKSELLRVDTLKATVGIHGTERTVRLEPTSRVSEDIKRDVTELLRKGGGQSSGGLGGLTKVGGGDALAVVVRESQVGTSTQYSALEIAIVYTRVVNAVSVPLLAIGVLALGLAGGVAALAMLRARRRAAVQILRGLPEAVISVDDTTGKVLFGNSCAESLLNAPLPSGETGWLVRRLLRRSGVDLIPDSTPMFRRFVHSDDHPILDMNTAARARWVTSTYEVRLRSGERIEVTGAPIRRPDNSIDSFGILRPVRESKPVEPALALEKRDEEK